MVAMSAYSQNADIIHTKDGNTYEGYIAKQIPGKTIVFVSNKSVISILHRDAKLERIHIETLDDLPEEYWEVFPSLPQDASVECAEIVVTEENGATRRFEKSVIVQGGEEIKFVSFDRQEFEFKWSTIRSVSKQQYDQKADPKVYDVIMLPTAERIEGQLLEQNLLNGLMTFKASDGAVKTYKKSAIQTLRTEFAPSETGSMWETIQYCDRINLKDGSSIDGFLFAKVFGQKVCIQHFNSEIKTDVAVADIDSYEKYPNRMYVKPLEEEVIVHETADLYVNGEKKEIATMSIGKKTCSIPESVDSIKTVLNAGANVVIQIKTNARTSKVRVANARIEKEKIVGVKGMTLQNKGYEERPFFSASDILKDLDVNFQSNDGESITLDFFIPKEGIYVVFVEGSDKCAVFKAK